MKVLVRIVNIINDLTIHGMEKIGRYYSVYRGFVIENEDPEGWGRIKIKVPELYGDKVFPEWVFPRATYSGKGYGMKVVPELKDMVSIEFRYGDPRKPLWSHGYFASSREGGSDITDEDLKRPNNKWFKTPKGIYVSLDDDESGTILVEHPSGARFRINEESIDLEIAEGKLINLGTFESASEPAMLGDTWQEKMESLIDNINLLTVPTAFGPSGTPINSPSFLNNKAELLLAKSKKVKLD